MRTFGSTLSIALMAAVGAAACGRAEARPPGSYAARVAAAPATDSTVSVAAVWGAPARGTPPFAYRWTVTGKDTLSGQQDSTAVRFSVPRADSAAIDRFCVVAANRAGTGPPACASFPVPAAMIAPGAPGAPDIQVDSSLALTIDSTTVRFSASTLAAGGSVQAMRVWYAGGGPIFCQKGTWLVRSCEEVGLSEIPAAWIGGVPYYVSGVADSAGVVQLTAGSPPSLALIGAGDSPAAAALDL